MQELSSLVGCEVPEKTIQVGASPKKNLFETDCGSPEIYLETPDTPKKNCFLVFETSLKIYFEKCLICKA